MVEKKADENTSTLENNKKEITTLVSSLADRKRNDLDYLRGFLVGEEPGGTCSKSSPEKTKKQRAAKPYKRPNVVLRDESSASWKIVRCLALDLPLLVLFSSLALVYGMQFVWTDYYVPLMERARRTDDDLLDEYTYYERTCTAEDVTRGFTKSTSNTTTKEALDTLLLHGATLIPNLLERKTVSNLRQYLKHRNRIIAEEEKYPMSQGYQRLSYGLEPTEDEAIVQALREITSNRLLQSLLEEVLGMKDPALSEITTITSFFGAEDQVIHSDTKSDGYAAQFARTYAHSYSLFIPVQPITTKMGVTQFCPGTHYCTNDLQEICEEEMFGINEAYEDEAWKAGDGVLINQQVWHGGTKHNDPNGPERILFILSFIARPQLGKDTRQLARGTYFHMKWSMWGHTFFDIAKDSAQSTAWPFNILRSLAIWKPRQRNWGYDLLLSAALRATNRQSGMEAEDLETFIHLKMNGSFHFPKWLQGTFSHEDENAWQTYIQGTLDKTLLFLQVSNAALLTLVLLLSIVVTLTTRGGTVQSFRLRSVLGRLALTHGLVACLAWSTMQRICSSSWGSKIASGETFMRSFPMHFSSERWEKDPTLPQGTSTLPDRMDVLFGTRYDAPWLGSYNRWLDFHPGNQVFNAAIAKRAYLYPMYNDLENNPVFLQGLISDVMDELADATKGGRLLQQDHLSGDWVAPTLSDTQEIVRTSLAIESNLVVKEVDRELKYLIAQYRFGRLRGTALALDSSLHLFALRKQLLRSSRPLFPWHKSGVSGVLLGPSNTDRPRKGFKFTLSSQLLELQATVPKVLSHQGDASKRNEEPKVGTMVMVFRSFDRSWAKGTVVEVMGNRETFAISYFDGTFEENVSIRRMRKPMHLQEGARVSAYFDQGTLHGTLAMVYANGHADIILDDGEIVAAVPPDYYDVQFPMF